jgi:F0F1-type ATP synthase assembly protein I
MEENPITQLTGYFVTQKEYIFVLLSLLFIFVIYAILEKIKLFGEDKKINLVLSICVGILAGFFLDEKLTDIIMKPYGLIGTILLFSIPFLILFYVTHKTYLAGAFRKITWAVSTIFLFGIFYQQHWPMTWQNNKIQFVLLGIGIGMIFLDDIVHKLIKRTPR